MENVKTPKIVIIYGSAGGGHKSVAQALQQALAKEYGKSIECELVDALELAPPPFDKSPQAYQQLIKNPQLWKQFYEIADNKHRIKIITRSLALYARKQAKAFLRNHPADLLVSVYHLANVPILELLEKQKDRPAFVTVVTDLVTTPPVWFDERVDMCIVPTAAARERALNFGLHSSLVKVIGLPIAALFSEPSPGKETVRKQLGWPADKPMVMMMAGGEGVGPLFEICESLEATNLDLGVAVICGKNAAMKKEFDSRKWSIDVKTYGFVELEQVRDIMQASDILVTKAGPTSITEAFTVGLPIVIYGHVPGQEDGNITYVTDEGAGVWAPTTPEVIMAVSRWIKHPKQRLAAAEASHSLATPEAGKQVVRMLGQILGL